VQAIGGLLAKWQEQAEQVNEVDAEDRTAVDQLQTVLELLKKKIDGPQTYSFSSMTEEHLDKFNISSSGELELKDDHESRALQTDSLGEKEHWSSDGLYRHFLKLEDLVPRKNEAAARLWINPIFYRVASMSDSASKIVLSVEQNVLPIRSRPMSHNSLSGFVDFTAILTSEGHARRFLRHPRLQNFSVDDHALFVTEAKGPDQILDNHTAQAIDEMYACAKHLGKTIIRGALTNGVEWVFFLLKLNEDGNGGKYFESQPINLVRLEAAGRKVSRTSCSLIAAIIAYWLQHSHEEIGSDDYFTMKLSQ
jgi:hypothetical protein